MANRATFGQNVGPFRKQVGCAVEFYFEGMSPRTATSMTAPSSPLSVSSAVEMPASPILKAQLCAPPKPSTTRKDTPKTVIHLSSFSHLALLIWLKLISTFTPDLLFMLSLSLLLLFFFFVQFRFFVFSHLIVLFSSSLNVNVACRSLK